MRSKAETNPFVFGQVIRPGFAYCPRPDLEHTLLSHCGAGRRVVLLGDRRMGKSSLVINALAGSGQSLLEIDLRGVGSIHGFCSRISAAINEHGVPTGFMRGLKGSFQEVKIGPSWLSAKFVPAHLDVASELLGRLHGASEGGSLIVFFDEFQDLAENLPPTESKELLGLLRATIQRHHRTAYVFAGSARPSMSDLFTEHDSPFYQTAVPLSVGPIPRTNMQEFLVRQFRLGDRKLARGTAETMIAVAGASPHDVQLFAFYVWSRSERGLIDSEALRTALGDMLAQVGPRAEDVWFSATPAQRRLLSVLASMPGGQGQISSHEFLQRASFARNSSALAAARPFLAGRNALLEKTGSTVRYRERWVRLWVLRQLTAEGQLKEWPDDYAGNLLEPLMSRVA
jgi:uncharacterized protein